MRGSGLIRRIQHFAKYGKDSRSSVGNQNHWISSSLEIRSTPRISSPGRRPFDRQFHNQSVRFIRTTAVLSAEDSIITVPPFPESVTEGDLRWNKNEGDTVLVDEIVCEIETDKTSMPVPSPFAGVITKRFVEDGATVKAGQQLYSIKIDESLQGQKAPQSKTVRPAAAAPPAAAPRPPPHPVKPSVPLPPPTPSPPPPMADKTPVTTPASALPKPKPVATPPPRPKSAPPPLTPTALTMVKVPPADPTKEIFGTRTEYRVKLSRIRSRIASRLKEAQNINALLTTFNEIDMSSIIEFRKKYQEGFTKKYGFKLGFMPAFLKASAYALQDQPTVNAVILDNEIVYRDYIDISVAVATPKGLVVPVVRNVESMSYADIEKSIYDLAIKARDNKLAIEDMDGGTFTVSNGGVYGSLMGTPIVNPPQSAILGMHATVERPVVVKGQIVIRPMMYVALTYDHRLIDGREAVLFLRKIKAAVEDPRVMLAGL